MLIKGNTDGLTLEQPIIEDNFLINIKSDYDVFYTTDGTEPNINSQRYFKPFAADGIVRAKAYDGQLWSNTSTLVPEHIAEWRIGDKFMYYQSDEEKIKTEGLFHRKQRTGEDYMLYLGMIIERKKISTALNVLFEDSGIPITIKTFNSNNKFENFLALGSANNSVNLDTKSDGKYIYIRLIFSTNESDKIFCNRAEITGENDFKIQKNVLKAENISKDLTFFKSFYFYWIEECAIYKNIGDGGKLKIVSNTLERVINPPIISISNLTVSEFGTCLFELSPIYKKYYNSTITVTSHYYGRDLTTEQEFSPYIYYEYSDEVPEIDASKYLDWQLAIQPSQQKQGGCVFVDCGDCKIYCNNTQEIRIRTINGEAVIPIDLVEKADFIMFVVNSKGECKVLGYDENENYIIKTYHVAVGNNIKIKGNSYFFFSDSLFLQNQDMLEDLMYNYV